MRLRPVYNKRFGQWKICHDQWCERGKTSIVATVLTSGDDDKDAEIARQLADRWNMVEDALK